MAGAPCAVRRRISSRDLPRPRSARGGSAGQRAAATRRRRRPDHLPRDHARIRTSPRSSSARWRRGSATSGPGAGSSGRTDALRARGHRDVVVVETGEPAAIREAAGPRSATGRRSWRSPAATGRSAMPPGPWPAPGWRWGSSRAGPGTCTRPRSACRETSMPPWRRSRRAGRDGSTPGRSAWSRRRPRRRRPDAPDPGPAPGRRSVHRRLRDRVRRPADHRDLPEMKRRYGVAAYFLAASRLLGTSSRDPRSSPSTASGPSSSRWSSWWRTAARRSRACSARACRSSPTTGCSTSSSCRGAGSGGIRGALELMTAAAAGFSPSGAAVRLAGTASASR